MELQNSINITYGILDNIFQILDTENVPVKQIIPCLTILLKKSQNDIANIVKKPHNFMRKTKSYLEKHPNDLEKLNPDFSEGNERRKACLTSNISFNNGSILEIHDYFRTGGNASLNNLSQIINTLSNQDFAGLDKFRLGESQGKISVQLLKINKIIEMKVV